jgi:predicted acyltransferase
MAPIPNRLRSLDAFRGLTIAGMILVNNPGSWDHVYAPLRHAPWHGWTPTDLIFPFSMAARSMC